MHVLASVHFFYRFPEEKMQDSLFPFNRVIVICWYQTFVSTQNWNWYCNTIIMKNTSLITEFWTISKWNFIPERQWKGVQNIQYLGSWDIFTNVIATFWFLYFFFILGSLIELLIFTCAKYVFLDQIYFRDEHAFFSILLAETWFEYEYPHKIASTLVNKYSQKTRSIGNLRMTNIFYSNFHF